MTTDGIRVSNLEGTVRAFAVAADQNNDGILEQGMERNIFDRLINEAGLSMDEGLQVERERVAETEDPMSEKKIKKDVKRVYRRTVGKKRRDEAIAAAGEADRRVADYYKDSKSEDKKSDDRINNAIAGRPDLRNYIDDVEGFKMALNNWADGVKDATRTSLVDTFKKTIRNCSDELAEEMDKLAQDIFDALNEQERSIVGSTQDIAADVVGYVNAHADEVAAELKDSNKRETIFQIIMNKIRDKIQERIQLRKDKSAQALGDN